jgi:hypothetical protein|tara:strand:- start:886 stop:1101 length:216 start_codon:yes stop_codon:yes gene_type:complete
MKYDIGDKVIEKNSKRTGKILDSLKESDENGTVTYSAVKLQFTDGVVEWINTDMVGVLLLEEEDSHTTHGL